MAHTNSTENYGLPQWIGTDKPTFLGDFNSAFNTIDGQMKSNADASSSAVTTANAASAAATTAATNATTALNTANSAASDAASAVTTAGQADTKATQALAAASSAETAASANTIANLAPAYDPTLTYNVGDLVTYIDAQGHGRLYKCIIQVASPMAFNINYWDDVTTSEVYRLKEKLIASGTVENTDTYADFLTALTTGLTLTPNRSYKLVTTYATGTQAFYNAIEVNSTVNYIKFSRTSGTASGNGTLETFTHDPTTNDTAYRYTFKTDDSVQYENLMSSTVPFTSYALFEV